MENFQNFGRQSYDLWHLTETLITILTIENLNSWQSLLGDNQLWHCIDCIDCDCRDWRDWGDSWDWGDWKIEKGSVSYQWRQTSISRDASAWNFLKNSGKWCWNGGQFCMGHTPWVPKAQSIQPSGTAKSRSGARILVFTYFRCFRVCPSSEAPARWLAVKIITSQLNVNTLPHHSTHAI